MDNLPKNVVSITPRIISAMEDGSFLKYDSCERFTNNVVDLKPFLIEKIFKDLEDSLKNL